MKFKNRDFKHHQTQAMSEMESQAPKLTNNAGPIGAIKIEFIIPAQNEALHISQCLESIASQKVNENSSLIASTTVVDNESTDRTSDIAREWGANTITVQPKNAAASRNRGTQSTDAELLAFIDADCTLPENWLSKCLLHFADDRVVAVGASQAYSGKDSPWIERVWTDIICPATKDQYTESDWLPAFNLVVRKDTFDILNGFDESLETCEDSDLTSRMSEMGILIQDHTIKVRHLGESRSITEFIQREMWRSRGNFQSAIKRKTVLKEFKSLMTPIAFAVFVTLLILSPITYSVNKTIACGLASFSSVFVLGLPLFIASQKGGHEPLLSRAIALSFYLLARGMGPFIQVARVKRIPEKK